MIKKIRLLLEYNTYCVWLYNENDEIIDNDNPPEWDDDQDLTSAFMAVSDIYDTFFVDNEKEFRYVGCDDERLLEKLRSAVITAVDLLHRKNNGKYTIVNDIALPELNKRRREK